LTWRLCSKRREGRQSGPQELDPVNTIVNRLFRRWPGTFWVVLATLPALVPLLRPGLIRAMDAYVHAFRLAEFHRVIQAGSPVPRWAPNFGYGYGDAVFNFYAPLTYYLAEVFHLLGLGLIPSLKAVWAVAVLLAAVAMYAWARELFGRELVAASVVAAVAYVYFPYFLVNLYERGALAEALALAIAPLAAWAVGRLGAERRLAYVPVAGLTWAALLLAHNIAALLFAPALAGYALALLVRDARSQERLSRWKKSLAGARLSRSTTLHRLKLSVFSDRWGAFWLLVLAGLLSLALTAFYWLPAWVELPLVSAERLTSQEFDPRTMLVPLARLVQTGPVYDYAQKNLGLLPSLLALAGLVTLPWLTRAPRGLLVTLAGLAGGQLWLMTDLARPLWNAVGLVSHLWPWRFLAGVGLCMAPLIGALVCHPFAGRKGVAGLLAAAIALVLIWSATADLPAGHWHLTDAELEVAGVHRQEFLSGHMGTSISSEYVPIWVQRQPGAIPRQPLSAAERGIDPAVSPPTVQVVEHTPFTLHLTTRGEAAGPVVLHAFYYPTQQATVDGQPVAVRPVGPLGLVAVDVPAGEHQLTLRQADTPIRQVGNVISLLAVVALAGLGLGIARWRGLAALVVPAALIVTLFSLPALLAAPASPVQPLAADFGPALRLVGYRLDSEANLTLYWQARGPITETLRVALGWQGSETVYGYREGPPVHGTAPFTTWEVGEIVPDPWTVALPSQAPPGEYRLLLAVLTPAGTPLGLVPLTTQTVTRPAAWPVEPSFQQPRDIVLGDETGQITLAGFDLGPWAQAGATSPVQPGQSLAVTLGWRARGIIRDDYSVALTLRDGRGKIHAQRDFLPVLDLPPTTQWPADQLVTRHYALPVPADLGPGAYELCLSLYDGLTGRRLLDATGVADVPLARVKIPYPHQAAPAHPAEVRLDDRIALSGYDVHPEPLRIGPNADENLYLTLYWRCLAPVDASYTVSAQVLGPDGVLWGQEDFEPVGGTYLTSDWGVGEVIPDTYRIVIWAGAPPGEYRLVVNMYDKATGATVPPGGVRVTVGTLTVLKP